MLSKRYESTEVDRRTWLHVPSGTHWSTSSYTNQVVEIQIETSTRGIWKVMHNHPYNFTQWSEKKDEGISVNLRIWGF